MSMNSFQSRPSSAAQQPLPQNRQAFGTISQRPTPGVNSAQPMAYKGASSGVKQATPQSGYQSPWQGQQRFTPGAMGGMQGGAQPGVSAVPQFGQQQPGQQDFWNTVGGLGQQQQGFQQQQPGFQQQIQQPQQFQGMGGQPQQTPGMQHYWGRQQARYGLGGGGGGGMMNAVDQTGFLQQRYNDPAFQQQMENRFTL